MTLLEFLSIYVLGGVAYGTLETLWRGYTHWTMILTGGVCCCFIHLIATRMQEPLWKKWILSAAVITTVEFEVGCLVNLILCWNVWDYSARPLNLLGQICPLFSLYWLLLSVPCVSLSQFLHKYVFLQQGKKAP